ncbi:MAG: MBL fold metallo-hydrolase [Gammaproteobacteria bacterium]|nr:MBL fold metallo-hydrolase [Gammaproteobacteria bacterium]
MNKIVLLGTKGGPRISKGAAWPTSSVLEIGGQPYLIDCGLGVTRQFVEAGYTFDQLQTLFITHHHSDHNLELGPLLHTAWTSARPHPIAAYGPTGLNALLDGFFIANAFDIETRMADEKQADLRALVSAHEYREGLVMENEQVKVTAIKVIHPPIVDCFALKFEFENKVVVFSGDTAWHPPFIEFCKGADYLIHECMLSRGIDALCERLKDTKPNLKAHLLASHTLATDVGKVATQAAVGHLILNHFVPSDDPAISAKDFEEEVRTTWAGPLSVGYDGFTLEI